jgi:hypothetical protein
LSQQRQNNTRNNFTHAPATKQTPPTRPPIKETSQHIQHNNAHQQENRCTFYSQPEKVLVAKMLASTMQISNNNPTNTLDPARARPQTKGGPEQPTRPTRGRRLILQDPTVCLTPSPTNAGP